MEPIWGEDAIRRSESDVWSQVEPVGMRIGAVDSYMAFCLRNGYTRQAGFRSLTEMMRVLAFVTVRILGPLTRMDMMPDGRTYEQWQRHADLVQAQKDWEARKLEAKHLFKQLYHLWIGATDMTPVSLSETKRYFDSLTREATHHTEYTPVDPTLT